MFTTYREELLQKINDTATPSSLLVARALPVVHSSLNILTKQVALQQKVLERLSHQNDHNLGVISTQVANLQDTVDSNASSWRAVYRINQLSNHLISLGYQLANHTPSQPDASDSHNPS